MTLDGYLVQYGRSAFVGRFAANGVVVGRGERVVVETVRGVEVGSVLAVVPSPTQPDGVTLRSAGTTEHPSECNDLLGRAEQLIHGKPVSFVDAERLIDGTCLLHVLPWGEVELTDVCERLSAEFGTPVRVFDVSAQEATVDPPTGCGKPDCGEGGCGTGGCNTCSRGSVKSAEELTAYFADLRRQMDDRRTPLH
jgi:hypothetical protein